MTKTQQAYIDALTDNLELAKQAGLLVDLEVEDCKYFVSVMVRVNHDRDNVTDKRNGHYNEIYAHLMIGKRGKIQGRLRTGSIFSSLSYSHDADQAIDRRVFQNIAGTKFADDILSMVRFTEKHNGAMAA